MQTRLHFTHPISSATNQTRDSGGETMFLLIFFILLILWLLGFTLFHVASGLIHLLLIVAVIALIVHFVRGRSVVA